MKLLWKVRLDNQPRQMHNLFPALIVSDVQTAQGPRELAIVAGVSDNIYGIDVEKGTQVWKRHFDSTFQETGPSRAYVLCPGGLTATPIVVPTRDAGQVHGLRDLVGRPAADARCRHRRGDGPRRAVPAAQRQALRAELPRQRALHDDRAGLRRQPEPVLFVRPRDQEGRQLRSRQRRAVAAAWALHRQGRPRVRRQRRRRLLSGAADLRPGHHRGQAEPDDQGDGDAGLVRAEQRLLAAQARPRHERDRSRSSSTRAANTPRSRARNAASGCSTPARSAARTTARRCTRRRSSATKRCSSRRRGPVGRARDLGRHRRHALGADAVLGTQALEVQGADRAWRGRAGRGGGVQARDAPRRSCSSRRPGSRATW